jgi:hypothetical protein
MTRPINFLAHCSTKRVDRDIVNGLFCPSGLLWPLLAIRVERCLTKDRENQFQVSINMLMELMTLKKRTFGYPTMTSHLNVWDTLLCDAFIIKSMKEQGSNVFNKLRHL